MNLKEYQIEAARTCPDLGTLVKNITHMDAGIFTEISELLDIYKKNLAYNKPFDKVHAGEEIADAFWYCVNKARLTKEELPELLFNVHSYTLDQVDTDYIIRMIRTYSQTEDELWLMNMLNRVAGWLGLDIYNLLDANIAKLKARFPDKFDSQLAINRNVENEYKILKDGTNHITN